MARLRPLLSEYERLIAAADTLATVDAGAAGGSGRVAPGGAGRAGTQTPPAQTAPTPERAPRAPARRERAPRGSAAGTFALAMSLRTTPLIQPPTLTPAAKTQERTTTPAIAEILERAAPAPSTIEGNGQAAPAPADDGRVPKREPASPAAVQQAILAALEHGSHTTSELVMVTAMSTREIRAGLRRLAGRGTVAKVKRSGDGKSAYALPSVAARA
jgi:hypothetical protein